MNKQIEELFKRAGGSISIHNLMSNPMQQREYREIWNENIDRFAELIIKECINQAHSVADLRGVNDDMVYGADTAAIRISKHFGIEV